MNRVQIRFVKDAIDNPEKLSTWENEFIDSIAEHGEDYELSEKQNTVLNRISQKLI